MHTNEIYQNVTTTITELLQSHLEDWNKPWIAIGQDNDYARNPSTGLYYRGINQFLLSFSLMKKEYLNNVWMTFKQIKDRDGQVLKGEKSTPVIFYKTAWIDKNKKYYKPETVKAMGVARMAELAVGPIPVLKLYRVFNVAQTSGLDDEFYTFEATEELQELEKDDLAEKLIQSTGADVEVRESNRAYYDRAADKIVLPLREQFKGQAEPFYSTALHELGHWTGHESRLARTFGKAFGDTEYAKEELVAELTSAFCCAHLGFSKTITNNASYIKHWLGIMKEDHKAIVHASAQAQKAADYIIEGPEYVAYRAET